MICASEARFSSRSESHMWTFAKGENNILWDLTKRLLKKKKKKTQKSARSARVPGAKSFVLSKNRNIKTKQQYRMQLATKQMFLHQNKAI